MPNNKIKILHIMPRFIAGGAEKMVLHYARLLDKEKFEVAVCSTVADGDLRPLFEKENIKLFISQGGRLSTALKLRKFVKEFKPQIIHTHLLGGDIFGYFFRAIAKAPVYWISTQHNVEFKTSLLRRLLWKRILKKADKIIAVADKVKRYDVSNFGLEGNKITVIKNGIDIEKFTNLEQIKALSPWRLGIVGRLQEQKGHVYLFKALSKLLNHDWQLNIFGDGPDKENLQILAKELLISDRLIWQGIETNPAKIFDSVDIIVQPSLWEGLSLVTMEALSAGRFVIASFPAGEELIIDKETGWLIAPQKIEEIVKALEYSFKHKNEIQTIATAAQVHALKRFDIRLNVEKLEQLYLSLL